jgi:hypothetical protein
MPIILATCEAEIKRIIVLGQPRQKAHKSPSQPRAGHSGVCLSSQAMCKTEMENITVPRKPRLKN